MTIIAHGNAAIKYTDDCGFYTLMDDHILDDGTGISGTFAQAWERLAKIFDANRIPKVPGFTHTQEIER